MAEDQTVKLPNGDLYVGQIAGGKPDGSGAFLDSNLPDCACLYASDTGKDHRGSCNIANVQITDEFVCLYVCTCLCLRVQRCVHVG